MGDLRPAGSHFIDGLRRKTPYRACGFVYPSGFHHSISVTVTSINPEPPPGIPLVPGAEPDLAGHPGREQEGTDFPEIVASSSS